MASEKGNDGRWYDVDTLSLADKIRLGFDKKVVEELKNIPEQKKIPVIDEGEKPKKKRTKKGV